jgi:hypothetical protein
MHSFSLRPLARCTIALALLLQLRCALGATELSYWIWGKRAALNASERAELARQGVQSLFRQVATTDGVRIPESLFVTATDLASDASAFTIVPVLRVEARDIPAVSFFRRLHERFPILRGEALQLDFDCPDRLLPDYATLLQELRPLWPKLSVTALAHWPEVKGFQQLARSIDEVCPMFYDLQRDPTGVNETNPPPPILDQAQFERMVRLWRPCPVPWRAGLPAFTRVTVFDHAGLSRGQIFGWDWNEITFNRHLRSAPPSGRGVQLLRVAAKATVARRPVEQGELIAVRQTEPAALANCRKLAEAAGAKGIVLFRLPEAGDGATHSLRALALTADARPVLRARLEGDRLILENTGEADLSPRLCGDRHDRDRGHTLEVDAPAAFFREAEPGQFFRVSAHLSPEKEPKPSSVTSATRLTFWFSQLEAGATLRSGIFQLSPHAAPARLRWRFGDGAWQPLSP